MASMIGAASFMLGFILLVSVSVTFLLFCVRVWQRHCGILCRKLCDEVRRAWGRRWFSPKAKPSSTSSAGEFTMVNHHVSFGSDVGQNFSPLIKLPGKAELRPTPSRVSYTPEGRPTRKILRQQFRINDDQEGRVRRAWRRWSNPKAKRCSNSSAGAFQAVNHHVFNRSDVGQNFSPIIKLPGKAMPCPTPSRLTYTPEGRRTRKVLRQQFRIKEDQDRRQDDRDRNDSVSRSSMLVTRTRSFGTFGTQFSGHSDPSVALLTSIHGGDLDNDDSLPEINRNAAVTAETSSSFSSAIEEIWSTTVLSRSPEIISSTPIKL